jgi:hypothetical protein
VNHVRNIERKMIILLIDSLRLLKQNQKTLQKVDEMENWSLWENLESSSHCSIFKVNVILVHGPSGRREAKLFLRLRFRKSEFQWLSKSDVRYSKLCLSIDCKSLRK